MNEFIYFIRKSIDSKEALTPKLHHEFLKSCEIYINKLIEQGRLISAQPLLRNGKIISYKSELWSEKEVNISNKIIGGYYHILANDLQEAVSIAKENPEFVYNRDIEIEVRPIKMKEETTEFVYPISKG